MPKKSFLELLSIPITWKPFFEKKAADSDPTKSPHNVVSAGFASGSVKGQYDVSAQARKKAAANSNTSQSPLAAG